jgi:transposase
LNSEETGIEVRTIRAIRKKYVERLKSEIHFETPCVLGIDGVRADHRIRRVIFTNIEAGEVVDLIKGGKKKYIVERIKQFPGFENIKIVTIDMCRTLLAAILEALPDAIIIIDVFHIVRTANQAMDKVRNRLFPHAKKKREPGQHDNPRPEPFRKRRADLTKEDEEYMQFWFVLEPELKLAYDLKEAYMALFDEETYGGEEFMSAVEAKRIYQEWESSLPVEEKYNNLLKDFKLILSAMNNWGKYVFNRFDHNFTNAYTESMNRKVKDILRESRGCEFETLHAKIVFGTRLRKELRKDRNFEMEVIRPRSKKRRKNGKQGQRAVKSKTTRGGQSKRYEIPNLDQIALEFIN